MISILLFIFILSNCCGYNLKNINSYYENMFHKPNSLYSVRNKNSINKDTSCILFLSGASGFIAPQIYSDFFNKLVNYNINVYCPTFNFQNNSQLIQKLNKKYKNVILMGHSSGGTTAINYAKNPLVKKLILLDPVDTRFVNKKYRNKNHDLCNLESVLFITAEKSYKINFNPFGLPFIPILAVTEKIFNLKQTCKILKLKAFDYGHGDILDEYFSNFLHNSRISVGTKNRNSTNLDRYKSWISVNIHNFLHI